MLLVQYTSGEADKHLCQACGREGVPVAPLGDPIEDLDPEAASAEELLAAVLHEVVELRASVEASRTELAQLRSAVADIEQLRSMLIDLARGRRPRFMLITGSGSGGTGRPTAVRRAVRVVYLGA